MNAIDHYSHGVWWSPEDDAYVGYCPAFFAGGVCHGSDPGAVQRELGELVAGEIRRYREEGLPLPSAEDFAVVPVEISGVPA